MEASLAEFRPWWLTSCHRFMETMFMFSKIAIFVCLAGSALPALSQAVPTASKTYDIQVGGAFVLEDSDFSSKTLTDAGLYGSPNFGSQTFKGAGAYSTIDFRRHIGIELDYRQAGGIEKTYERNYEGGLRYVWHRNRLAPYVKGMYGRGVFNFPPYPGDPSGLAAANLAYNFYAFGGGTDYALKSYLNLRADFEYQKWGSDPYLFTNGISPLVFSVGAAWHFR
jgi:opacity protein-like surface antigen